MNASNRSDMANGRAENFVRHRMNPNGGSVALGHPFARPARILSPGAPELSGGGVGKRAVVSICTDGGQGTVALLEAA